MAAPVTFGIDFTFENPEAWGRPWQQHYEAVLEQIEWIDRELRFDGVYVSEHHFYEDGYLPAPLLMCAVLAGRTSRVEIGTNVLQLPLHHPIRVAEEALVVDILCGGRLRLGIGMGYYHQELLGLGTPTNQRVSRVEEGVDILRAAFSGEPFSRDGKRFQLPEVRVTPPPLRPGGPPIWMGAFVPAAVERAARIADGFMAIDESTVGSYFEACDRVGRPAEERRLNRTYWSIVAEDPERAFAEAGPHWMYLFNEYIKRDAYPELEPFEDPQKALEAARADGLIMVADGPGAVAEFNRAVAQGAIDITLLTLMPGEDPDAVAERLQYISDEVIPNVDHSESPAIANRRTAAVAS
jgi:alkanesulfonate monooxygenase SsuD/methylene tetrahydromethanopterin reductase-like flavin-dependent oxidoreductase (luciferase family)